MIEAPLVDFWVYPTSEICEKNAPRIPSDCETALLLCASSKADVSIGLPNLKQTDELLLSLASLSAAIFIDRVRAIPFDELEVESNGNIYVAVRNAKNGKIGISIPKCKQALTKSRVFTSGVDVLCSEYTVENRRIILRGVKEGSLLNEDALRSLLLSASEKPFDVAVGYTEDDIVSLKCISPRQLTASDILAAVISVARNIRRSGFSTAKFLTQIGECEIAYTDGGLMLLTK